MVTEWQKRQIKERDTLKDNISKLAAWLNQGQTVVEGALEKTTTLPTIYGESLFGQLRSMTSYLKELEFQISLWDKELETTTSKEQKVVQIKEK